MADVPLEAQIEKAQADVKSIKTKLDALAKAYTDEVKKHLPEFFRAWVGRSIEKNPAVAERLGVDGLRGIKQELNQVIDQIPALVDAAMPSEADWWHHGTIPADQYSPGHDVLSQSGQGVQDRLRRVLKPLGALMVRHGLAEVGHEKEWEGSRENPSYKYGFQWPDAITKAIGGYVSGFKTLVQANNSLNSLQQRKRERDAKNLWDQA